MVELPRPALADVGAVGYFVDALCLMLAQSKWYTVAVVGEFFTASRLTQRPNAEFSSLIASMGVCGQVRRWLSGQEQLIPVGFEQ